MAAALIKLAYATPPPKAAGELRRTYRTVGTVLAPVVVISTVTISLSSAAVLLAGWIALILTAS